MAGLGKVWGKELKETRSLGTSERQSGVVPEVGQEEGLELDGWGRVSLANQEISARCLPGLRLAPPSKVGSGSPGTICCWRGRAEAQLGWGRGGPGTGASPFLPEG